MLGYIGGMRWHIGCKVKCISVDKCIQVVRKVI